VNQAPGHPLRAETGVAALGLAVAAFSLFAVGDAASKLVVAESTAGMALWGRSVAFAVVMLTLVRPRHWRSLLLDVPVRLVLLRSLFPFLGGVCIIISMAYVPLAQLTTVLFVAPLISMALGRTVLGETVNRWGWFAVALGLLGVVTITRPFDGSFSWVLLLPALGGIFTAIAQVLTRVVAQQAPPRSMVVYTMLVALLLSTLALPFVWQAPTSRQWLFLAMSGLCQAVGQACMIAAYLRAGASRIAPNTYAQLLTATLIGFAVFDEAPDVFSVFGAGLIVAGGLVSLKLAGRGPAAAVSPRRGGRRR
jgi:drug/metabolite transporter (DMT)-like permease